MLDRHWLAVVRPTAALLARTRHLDSSLTLVTGAIMTAMIVAYLLISLRRTNQIATVARRDALTGLPNRLYFQERLAQAVAGYRHDAPFAILSLDLDGFKAVNDTLGHVTGDALLCLVAARIAGCLREVDGIARLGGDEFALILADKASEEKIASVAARLIGEVGKPYSIDEQTIVVGASIGIAVATAGTSAERLLKEADLALYEAKDAGRGTYRFFETRLRLQMEAKRALEGEMRRGLENGEFELYYQPIINLAQGRVTSFEALLRWNHPQHGLLAADRFITVAEESGLIVPLGAWALRTACDQAVRWPVPAKVAVNISPRQFKDEDLASNVLRCLTLSGLPPQRLEIEITEAAVLQEADATLAVFRDLRTMGVTVAFDDFGTGFSSLSSLLRFRFDKLKIDRSFLAPIETSENARAIVRAIVELGSHLEMVTTGEGVETREQLADLQRLGCSEAQGYFFSRPRPNRDVPRLLRELNGYSSKVIGTIGSIGA